ncbi:MAG: hypothetical protein HY747_07370 [Elusimicrobia bacterium]|nr:hypothetical protein [Elusimicrobiota bacterium]
MKMRVASFALFASFALLAFPLRAGFLPDNAFSNKARGTTAASFLKLSASPRTTALADTINISAADPLAGFHMPAFYSAFPGQRNAALASRESGFPWGASLSFAQSKIGPEISGQAAFVNLGLAVPYGYFADPNLSFSFSVINLGPPADWNSRAVALPLRGQIQMGYKVGELSFLSLDGFLPVDQAAYGAVSIEWKMPFEDAGRDSQDPEAGLAVRVGVTSKNKTDNFSGKTSFGLGLYLGRLVIDAGLAPFGNMGFYPHFGINLAF